jgi:hypothetical protein
MGLTWGREAENSTYMNQLFVNAIGGTFLHEYVKNCIATASFRIRGFRTTTYTFFFLNASPSLTARVDT